MKSYILKGNKMNKDDPLTRIKTYLDKTYVDKPQKVRDDVLEELSKTSDEGVNVLFEDGTKRYLQGQEFLEYEASQLNNIKAFEWPIFEAEMDYKREKRIRRT